MLILCKQFLLKEWIICQQFVFIKYVHLEMVDCQNLAKNLKAHCFCYFFKKPQDLRIAEGSTWIFKETHDMFFKPALCFEAYAQVRLKFKILTSTVLSYHSEVVPDL